MGEEKKSEEALFRELKWLLPTTSAKTYFINGAWQRELLKVDLEIIKAHRREAGAPDPEEPLDLKKDLPELQQLDRSIRSNDIARDRPIERPRASADGPARGRADTGPPRTSVTEERRAVKRPLTRSPPRATPIRRTLSAPPIRRASTPTSTTISSRPALPPRRTAPPTKAPSHPTARPLSRSPQEPSEPPPGRRRPEPPRLPLRSTQSSAERQPVLIRDFVAKWGLEETKTKMLLARLPPLARVEAMKTFRPTSGQSNMAQLDSHVRNAESKGGSSGRAAKPPPSTPRSSSAPLTPRPGSAPVGARPGVGRVTTASRGPAASTRSASTPVANASRTASRVPAPRTPPRSPERGPSRKPAAPAAAYAPARSTARPRSPDRMPSRMPSAPSRSTLPLPGPSPPSRPPPSSAASYSRLARPAPYSNGAANSAPNGRSVPSVSSTSAVRRPRPPSSEPPPEPAAKRARPLGSVAASLPGVARPTPKTSSAPPRSAPSSVSRPTPKVSSAPPRSAPSSAPSRPSPKAAAFNAFGSSSRPGSLIRSLL
eukprot:TRINITY_DN5998_c0_g1_i2.p1 TRINITY_DN5998_c0_g1~~TRINITY_DN5998_c0_g1_i2.p1  ORF type:complete len:543 (+),score=58.81 TRINITY_DN5998_c0_g1_i2:253-1881(+)